MEDDELEFEDDYEEESPTIIRPEPWSWKCFVGDFIGLGSAVLRNSAQFLDQCQAQFVCGYLYERQARDKEDAATEAKRLLAALDEL